MTKDDIGRSPHGERGLKSKYKIGIALRDICRSPHGERGLKLHNKYHL